MDVVSCIQPRVSPGGVLVLAVLGEPRIPAARPTWLMVPTRRFHDAMVSTPPAAEGQTRLSCKTIAFPLAGSGEHATNSFNQGHGLSLLPPGERTNAQLSAQTRTLRIRHNNSLDFSIGPSISPLPPCPIPPHSHSFS